jgi:hypothetical protein
MWIDRLASVGGNLSMSAIAFCDQVKEAACLMVIAGRADHVRIRAVVTASQDPLQLVVSGAGSTGSAASNGGADVFRPAHTGTPRRDIIEKSRPAGGRELRTVTPFPTQRSPAARGGFTRGVTIGEHDDLATGCRQLERT